MLGSRFDVRGQRNNFSVSEVMGLKCTIEAVAAISREHISLGPGKALVITMNNDVSSFTQRPERVEN